MAEDGIVGEFKKGEPREVLYSWEEWEALKNGGGACPGGGGVMPQARDSLRLVTPPAAPARGRPPGSARALATFGHPSGGR